MALKTAALTILVVLSLVFADQIRASQQLRGGGHGQELVADGGGGGGAVSPKDCREEALYHGPCIKAICAVACLLQMRHGGHCPEGLVGPCSCFVCD
nr:unnamed protein product [Digitaria exilis]